MKFTYLVAAAVFALAGGAAQAHAQLEASEPKAASTVDAAPKLIRLQFNERLEAAFSKISLRDAANHEVVLPKAELAKDSPKALAVAVPPLAPGDYRVQWSAATRDGHKVKGEFGFKVR